MSSIWNSIEVDCWSRSFSYDDYVDYHKERGNPGVVISEEMYYALCDLCEKEYTL